jgi:hypothetical protein
MHPLDSSTGTTTEQRSDNKDALNLAPWTRDAVLSARIIVLRVRDSKKSALSTQLQKPTEVQTNADQPFRH